ncbi:integrase family protein [Paenibacillus vortex V453]|uniref:Integrase family protein n=2 Tax=Paenibacillus TaxID=44249 RepID=A0A2R9T2U7_9BACL|nr:MULTISPECIES: tyrosine-type recombinase/integrase [Paenibacillus]EFU43936.1 integrase family protein [Paenibacillus vortex V453]MDH6673640.1 site-specific recombinase XerD [Paenibacillus sp. LBL]OMF73017.1 integrase [Paenibacillus glucanolyticus]
MSRIQRTSQMTSRHWEDILEEFLRFKLLNGIAKTTHKDYIRTVNLLFKRFPDAWGSYYKLEEAVIDHLNQEGIAPATFNSRLTYLRTFFKWCVEEGHLKKNPLTKIKKRKEGSRIVAISIETLQELIRVPDQSTFVGMRDYTLIIFTLDTGIRPSEALALQPNDFNLISGWVRIPDGAAKTRVSRTLNISPVTVDALKRLIDMRPRSWANKVPVFSTETGNVLNRHTWGDRLERHSKQVGVHITPYALRHAFALEFLRNGASAFSLQKTLGHVDISMTKRYVALADEDLKRDHIKASPLNKLI